jgi:hypothetical protein
MMAADSLAVPSASDGDPPNAGAPQPAQQSLEQKLRRAFHRQRGTPHSKELAESFAFFKAIAKLLRQHRPWPLIIDVAGGHGILAALCLVYGKAPRVVVVDPHRPPNADAVLAAWAPFLARAARDSRAEHSDSDDASGASDGRGGAAASAPARFDTSGSAGRAAAAELDGRAAVDGRGSVGCVGAPEYVHEALRTALPRLLAEAQGPVLVLACHACAHLSEALVQICAARRPAAADFAIMPCCQRSPGAFKLAAAKGLGLELGAAMDMVLVGKCMQLGFECSVRLLDRTITPQNRLIIGRAPSRQPVPAAVAAPPVPAAAAAAAPPVPAAAARTTATAARNCATASAAPPARSTAADRLTAPPLAQCLPCLATGEGGPGLGQECQCGGGRGACARASCQSALTAEQTAPSDALLTLEAGSPAPLPLSALDLALDIRLDRAYKRAHAPRRSRDRSSCPDRRTPLGGAEQAARETK